MKIIVYFKHSKLGLMISITDSKFDNLSDDEIKRKIGQAILLVSNSCAEKFVEVKYIDIATSLIGKKNINICLSDSIQLSDIKPDYEFFFISKKQLLDEVKTGENWSEEIMNWQGCDLEFKREELTGFE